MIQKIRNRQIQTLKKLKFPIPLDREVIFVYINNDCSSKISCFQAKGLFYKKNESVSSGRLCIKSYKPGKEVPGIK